jgi:hypothetical protein
MEKMSAFGPVRPLIDDGREADANFRANEYTNFKEPVSIQ